MCLDIIGGPAHELTYRTSLLAVNSREPWEKSMEPECYELVPCPNQFQIKESLMEPQGDPENDVFHTTQEDNGISLSCEDRKFVEIMETGIHKNDGGNWEMPLPFRREDVKMPKNWSQAVSRLNGLIHTLRRKPQMEMTTSNLCRKSLTRVMCPFHQRRRYSLADLEKVSFSFSLLSPSWIWHNRQKRDPHLLRHEQRRNRSCRLLTSS